MPLFDVAHLRSQVLPFKALILFELVILVIYDERQVSTTTVAIAFPTQPTSVTCRWPLASLWLLIPLSFPRANNSQSAATNKQEEGEEEEEALLAYVRLPGGQQRHFTAADAEINKGRPVCFLIRRQFAPPVPVNRRSRSYQHPLRAL